MLSFLKSLALAILPGVVKVVYEKLKEKGWWK